MEKLAKHQHILENLFAERAAMQDGQGNNIKSQLIVNKDKTNFILLAIGWMGKKYIHTTTFHLELKGEKIWIHDDRTDVDVADLLVEKGVDKSNIVLGYLSPFLREFSDYAVA